jgi:hypothetical protein
MSFSFWPSFIFKVYLDPVNGDQCQVQVPNLGQDAAQGGLVGHSAG